MRSPLDVWYVRSVLECLEKTGEDSMKTASLMVQRVHPSFSHCVTSFLDEATQHSAVVELCFRIDAHHKICQKQT